MSQPILDFKIDENRWEYLEQSTQNWKMVKQDEVAITKEQCKTIPPMFVACHPTCNLFHTLDYGGEEVTLGGKKLIMTSLRIYFPLCIR